MGSIGPAVFNGGLTTFLALMLLGASTSHTFFTFFKVFVLTVFFGLFHGLLLLPVLLSLAGPAGEENDDADAASSDNNDVTAAGDDNRAFQSEEAIKPGNLDPSW